MQFAESIKLSTALYKLQDSFSPAHWYHLTGRAIFYTVLKKDKWIILRKTDYLNYYFFILRVTEVEKTVGYGLTDGIIGLFNYYSGKWRAMYKYLIV